MDGTRAISEMDSARHWPNVRLRGLKSGVAILAAAVAGYALPLSPAFAATGFDGLWSVVIVTESGTCDRAYRYPVRITNGVLRHAETGDASFVITGKVEPDGAVHGSVTRDSNSAVASGQLSGQTGGGRWRGKGSGGACSGRWEAERRDAKRQTNGSAN